MCVVFMTIVHMYVLQESEIVTFQYVHPGKVKSKYDHIKKFQSYLYYLPSLLLKPLCQWLFHLFYTHLRSARSASQCGLTSLSPYALLWVFPASIKKFQQLSKFCLLSHILYKFVNSIPLQDTLCS